VPRDRRPLHALPAVLLVLTLLGAVALAGAATQLWGAPAVLALPSGAAANPAATVGGASCTAAGSCTLGGSYADAGGTHAYVESESGGSWGTPVELALPSSGPYAAASNPDATVTAVSCADAGGCAVTGHYADATGTQAFVADETAGTWGAAQRLDAPPDADGYAISCPSAGNCVAGGTDTNGGQAYVALETSGVWDASLAALTMPNGHTANAAVDALSCSGPGSCTAAGDYSTSAGYEPWVASESGGQWGSAVELTLPQGAATSGQDARAVSIACTSPGNCVTGGQYLDTGALQQGFVATETNGTWGAATQVSLPANVGAGVGAGVTSVSCPSAGSCLAAGDYLDGAVDAGFVAGQAGGAWGQAVQAGEPSGGQLAQLTALSCTAQGACLAAGRYEDSNGDMRPTAASSVPALAIASASLPGGVQGSAYSAQLAGSGGAGPYAWSVSAGALPPGLSLNAASGTISGTPTVVGDSTFTIELRDPGPPAQQVTQTFSIAVALPPATRTILGAVKIKKHSASFSFSADGSIAGFQCALVKLAKPKPVKHHKHHKHHKRRKRRHRRRVPVVKPPQPRYATCVSPRRFRYVATGSWEFYVRAVLVDGTPLAPATKIFKIR
jgi:hypothetical protein